MTSRLWLLNQCTSKATIMVRILWEEVSFGGFPGSRFVGAGRFVLGFALGRLFLIGIGSSFNKSLYV